MKVRNKSALLAEDQGISACDINPYYAIIYYIQSSSSKVIKQELRGREAWCRLKDKLSLCTPFNAHEDPAVIASHQ